MGRKILKPELVFDLINAFKSISSIEESVNFLQDILTANEIKNLSVRLGIAKLLIAGVSQRQIAIQLSTSIATVTKVNSWLNQKGNGFKKIISRLPIKYNVPNKITSGPIEFHMPELLVNSAQWAIATSQNKRSKKLITSLKEKELSDKFLRKISNEYYKTKRAK